MGKTNYNQRKDLKHLLCLPLDPTVLSAQGGPSLLLAQKAQGPHVARPVQTVQLHREFLDDPESKEKT